MYGSVVSLRSCSSSLGRWILFGRVPYLGGGWVIRWSVDNMHLDWGVRI